MRDRIEIELHDGRTDYEPGSEVRGRATWFFRDAPERLEARLFWYTRGRGTQDVEIVQVVPLGQGGGSHGWGEFRFQLPRTPYSYSGQLVSICWAVEVVSPRSDVAARAEIRMAPRGHETTPDRRVEVGA
jgi:hypothetical protein